MILADTSVWINFLRQGNESLEKYLGKASILMHPMILGELCCGNLKNRQSIIDLWNNLPQITVATHHEALYFLEENRLMGRGIGYVDLHLLASTALERGVLLWTEDKRLASLAQGLDLS